MSFQTSGNCEIKGTAQILNVWYAYRPLAYMGGEDSATRAIVPVPLKDAEGMGKDEKNAL